MNKFQKLADKLISGKMWKSKLTLIQLEKVKNGTNVVYTDQKTKDMNCVKKETTKKLNNDKFEFFTEFFISILNVNEFEMDKSKLSIEYNGKRYNVFDISFLGTIDNQDSLVKLVVKR